MLPALLLLLDLTHHLHFGLLLSARPALQHKCILEPPSLLHYLTISAVLITVHIKLALLFLLFITLCLSTLNHVRSATRYADGFPQLFALNSYFYCLE